VGIDIGSSFIKAVEVTQTDGKILLKRCGVASTEGIDPIEPLQKLLAEANITARYAAVSVAAPEVVVRPFAFPKMPRKELLNAIRLESETELLHGRTKDLMAVDWHTFPEGTEEVTRGLLAIAPKAALFGRVDLLKKAGLRPVVADVAGLALWNAYWALRGSKESSPQTVLLMNIGSRSTNLVIAKGPDGLMLVRDLPLGAKALTEGQEKEWITEVRDSLGYARSHGGLRELDGVFLTGGGSGRDLKMLLATAAGGPVDFWDPLEDLGLEPGLKVDQGVGPLLAVAIGLALRQPT